VDDEDAQRYVQTLFRYQEMCGYKLYAYCLMNNHIHLLIKEEEVKQLVHFMKLQMQLECKLHLT
jgi:REP element-mobilizing transposase RayT